MTELITVEQWHASHTAGRTAKRRQLEHEQQRELIRWSKLRGATVPKLKRLFAIPNGGDRNIVVAAKLKAEGVKPGVWDLFLPVASRGYHGLWIEMKIPPNKLTPEQKQFQAEVTDEGYDTVVCESWNEAAEYLCWYLKIAE